MAEHNLRYLGGLIIVNAGDDIYFNGLSIAAIKARANSSYFNILKNKQYGTVSSAAINTLMLIEFPIIDNKSPDHIHVESTGQENLPIFITLEKVGAVPVDYYYNITIPHYFGLPESVTQATSDTPPKSALVMGDTP